MNDKASMPPRKKMLIKIGLLEVGGVVVANARTVGVSASEAEASKRSRRDSMSTSVGSQLSYRNRPSGGARAEARLYAVRKAPWRLGRDRRERQQRRLREEEPQARPYAIV